MKTAFLIPGFSPDRNFTDSSLDLLKDTMLNNDIVLHGITNSWSEYGIKRFGELAVEQHRQYRYDGILIGHSLGALAALSVVDAIPISHLILCSPSALFAEDVHTNLDPNVGSRIGKKRLQELRRFSAAKAVSTVNTLRIPTTILFGEIERELHPQLVARSEKLAKGITDATLIEVAGAAHFIGENPYAIKLARVVNNIA